jgi:diguanylate cyclase (GGDEF)-like protein/PAS domain S-box-containing protein
MLRFPELVQVIDDTTREVGAAPTLGQLAARRTELLVLAGRVDAARSSIRADYLQALAAGNGPMRAALEPDRQRLDRQLEEYLGAVQTLAAGGVEASGLVALDQARSRLLDALDRAWLQSGRQLGLLLDARVDALYRRMALHGGTALLLLGCILSLVCLVARHIARPLRQLAGVADAVRRSGDQALRADWRSGDEIGKLVVAFNGMLAQLETEREARQELAARARAAQAQAEIVEAIPVPMMVTSIPDHAVLHANALALPWLGGGTADPWRGGLESGVRARFFQTLADRGAVDEFEVRWQGGAEPAWAVLSARQLQFQGRDALLTAFTPINVLKGMEQRLELWSKVFEASSEGILIMDAHQGILSVNQAMCRATSYDYYELLGQSLEMLLHDAEPRQLAARIGRAVADRDSWQGEVALRRRSGEAYPAWLVVSAVRHGPRHGGISHCIGISVDITDRKRTEARVQHLADHDALTGLPNRSLCTLRLREALEDQARTGAAVTLLFLDLDRFKAINDTLGHHVGDGVLRAVADRLSAVVGPRDTVSRLGGDEFVVLLRDAVGADAVRALVERQLIPMIAAPCEIAGQELQVSCSVGAAIVPAGGCAPEELMRQADAAMYEAKSAGRNCLRFFSAETDRIARERHALEYALRRALAHGELSLHYQPRLEVATGRPVGLEALLRWSHPEWGNVPPARFIPLAEETGLIHEIGRWVVETACDQLAQWRAQGWPGLEVSINISATQLGRPGLPQCLAGCIARHGLPPHCIELEITETQLMENAGIAGHGILALKALGVRLAVDDFGTGYSSLAYLKRFALDKLKIDQSFVRELLTGSADLPIVRAIIALGHGLGLGVVAEGVESAEVAERLRQLGCDELQGFHFARPMPAADVRRWLAARGAAAPGGPHVRPAGPDAEPDGTARRSASA